jgi:hypothetical protein
MTFWQDLTSRCRRQPTTASRVVVHGRHETALSLGAALRDTEILAAEARAIPRSPTLRPHTTWTESKYGDDAEHKGKKER